ncbi:MAG: NHL repeat-containing protein, partial [Actinomycetota bacterium]
FVNDSGNARVKVYELALGGTTAASATFVRTIGGPGGGQPVPPGSFGPAGNLRGIAVDEVNGWVYVVDAATGFTSKFTLTGAYLTRFGGRGVGNGRFPSGGRGVTVDQQGRVWVADLGQFRVHVFNSNGVYQFQVPNTPTPPPLGGFNNPSDVAVDEQGNIWVIDTMNQRFQKFSPQGVALQAWGSRGGGTDLSFNYPRAIAVDDTGPGCPTYTCVLVGDTDAGSIVKFDANGNTVWSVGGGGAYKAWEIATAPDGTIFFPDVSQNRVVVLSPSGSVIRTFGSSGSTDGRFQRPRGIAYDPDGTIWVSDATRNNIQHFSATGQFLGAIVPTVPVQQLQGVQVNGTYVFVADNKTHKILTFTKSGQFVASTVGGGTGLGRTLGPMGMDVAGNSLYVAEANGNRVQEFRIGT